MYVKFAIMNCVYRIGNPFFKKNLRNLFNNGVNLENSLYSCNQIVALPVLFNSYRAYSSGTKRGDTSSKPHKREYPRIKNPTNVILDEDGVLADQEYADMVHNSGVSYGSIFNSTSEEYKVAVLQPWIKWGPTKRQDTSKELLLEEACALVQTLTNCNITYKEVIPTTRLSKYRVFGDGKLLELSQELSQHRPLTAVFISYEILTKAYKRELEELFKTRVLDRYTIVLSIFQQHAHTLEARLQVALAEIPYVRAHVSDDKHRLILSKREKKLKDSLDEIAERRQHVRKEREKNAIPSVAIVGYTNAGKTSLIRAITGDDNVMGKNHLFATLDVTAHKCFLPSGFSVLLLDTVGFIQDIPTNLIASFMATLEDAVHADIVVHVRDSSHPDRSCQAATVMDTLQNLPLPATTPVITINSKIDVVTSEAYVEDENWSDSKVIPVSAMTGEGLDTLLEVIEEKIFKILGKQPIHMKLLTGSVELNWLRKNIGITRQEVDTDNPQCSIVTAIMNERDMAAFRKVMKSVR